MTLHSSLWCNGRCRRFRCGDGRTRIRAATGWEPAAAGPKRAGYRGGMFGSGDAVRGGEKDKYVLARPRKGPVASVPEATCTADPGADALTLDNPEKAKITDAMLGHWVEISGRLESETEQEPGQPS